MADDLGQSSSDSISVDYREKHSSQEYKLEFSEDEETLITRMFNLVGERWALIAGRIPGRTAEEIEKYWTSRCSTSQQTRKQQNFVEGAKSGSNKNTHPFQFGGGYL